MMALPMDPPVPNSRDEFINECWRQCVAAEKAKRLIDPTWLLVLIQELQHARRVALLSQYQLVTLRSQCKCQIT